MQLYSTNNPSNFVSLKEAVLKGLADDKGLYMPKIILPLTADFLSNLKSFSFQEIAFNICKNLFQSCIPDKDLELIVNNSIDFPAPLVPLTNGLSILELFHGPSLAFKDFGARFMAELMSYFNQDEDKELVILVATSGDTGGAVASGFYKALGIKVVILYPSGNVSPLQEKQLTSLGENIIALEIDGTFDDCQRLVKAAFLDQQLDIDVRLSSANSINIARLIPQSFYYFEAFKQLENSSSPTVFCIPSGNFGNLTAGLFAKKMGLPIHKFIAATNVNDIVPTYLTNGIYKPMPSISTISNAMDVGDPSNFVRIQDLYCSTWNNIKNDIQGYSFNDDETKEGIYEVFKKYKYIIDPHGAVGYLAMKDYLTENPSHQGIILETAHASKFMEIVENVLNIDIEIPERLANLANKKKVATFLPATYDSFKDWLQDTF